MCWLDDTTLAVGRSYRTNAAAHAQLPRSSAARASQSSGPTCPTTSARHT